jgi:hypothetical protein
MKLYLLSDQCRDCFNILHCARGCPEVCPLRSNFKPSAQFDCTILRWIGLANIIEMAGYDIQTMMSTYSDSFFDGIRVEPVNESIYSGKV